MSHMSTYELIDVCVALKNKLHSISEDCMEIHKSCIVNQDAFDDIQLNYALAIDYLAQQHFIKNNANAFESNQIATNQKIRVLSECLDLLKGQIDILVERIENIDIRSINNTIAWLEENPHP